MARRRRQAAEDYLARRKAAAANKARGHGDLHGLVQPIMDRSGYVVIDGFCSVTNHSIDWNILFFCLSGCGSSSLSTHGLLCITIPETFSRETTVSKGTEGKTGTGGEDPPSDFLRFDSNVTSLIALMHTHIGCIGQTGNG